MLASLSHRLLLVSAVSHSHFHTMTTPRDVQEFLNGYPRARDDSKLLANHKFYSNQLRCQPSDLLIEEIHDQWMGDYDELEYNHGFIQWLFPIQEGGMNYEAQVLQPHEIAKMKADPVILGRILSSYKLMLDFYGMRLVSPETGLLGRSIPPRNYAPRYKNLIRSSHNNLRITRILKCLSEFGFEYLNAGFLLHVLNEQSENDQLNSPRIRDSMDRWWANCIRNHREREWIGKVISDARQEHVFTREMYESALERRRQTRSLAE
ncbi:hypothetical protein SERLA73DRAFT_183289 [Serpula lacrymans var. lacrymans S7.3]|uniref:Opioid growth factor receptor (OGFr) conserved domain-containing protein n=2 Tax=Serpula lacrymans var. lacrymans TaxID=341189 RepID=F8PZL5_SERL3|nr:uncharacterized protein SERLADRAFT_470369 [Serpula lacrymans var. lacrymans S7.9]EGN98337.1 hypothetical protein SERLA73DRAFT_183289 [Serpula lacrymans var. lacrymans S7.3]EGO23903.1 hypothetical protein SERLADRAFT_470369 [Serpula lacrymans var. lacrymans S7.9]